MPLIVFHTKRVRDALKRQEGISADLFFLSLVAAVVCGLVIVSRQAQAPFEQHLVINLSPWALPKYTLLSLGRGFAAYVFSLLFTLIYGTVAAHNQRAEKVMLPALDVLQAIPVLGFLPIVVLSMIRLFPTRELGLELACVLMIFTAQAWNMTFSFHGSLRSIPQPLREVAAVQGLSWWQTFRLLEVPAAMIGLVWNSMMSMAGGWFFLMVNEAFTLGDRDFRLPGIGSYMSEAMNHFDPGTASTWKPVIAAVLAMILMIVAVDQLFWRPIVVWAQRFKLEELAQADAPQSWVLNVLAHSHLFNWVHAWRSRRQSPAAHAENSSVIATSSARRMLAFIACIAATVLYALGAIVLIRKLMALQLRSDAEGPADWISIILVSLAWLMRAVAIIGLATLWAMPAEIIVSRSAREFGRLQVVNKLAVIARWSVIILCSLGALGGTLVLIKMLVALPLRYNPASHSDWFSVILALLASFARTMATVVLGTLWALPVGILIGRSPKWSQRLQPVIQVVASFPAPMLFPLVVLILAALHIPFTIGCTALMLLGAQWYILFNVIAGASAIPSDLDEVTEVYRMTRREKWTKLYLPCVFPYLVTGLITATGGAWNATIVAEFVTFRGQTLRAFGLGSIISDATTNENFPLLAAGVVAMAVFVVLMNRFFWKKLYHLAETRYSLNV